MEKKRGKRKNRIKKKEEKQARKPCPTKAGPFPLKRSSSLYVLRYSECKGLQDRGQRIWPANTEITRIAGSRSD